MPQTLLIVDDSQPLHELVKVQLGTEDFLFDSSYTGTAALDSVAATHPDLILLDVDLPDMNGFDVCRFLKGNPATARIPVIFLTASSSTDEKVCGMDLQAADYITKPFDPEELACRVRAALRTKRLLDLLPTAPVQAVQSVVDTRPLVNAKLTLSQLQDARRQNPWNRKPPAKLVGN